MKAFVTGAAGFMGSAVVRALLEDGQEVRALVRSGSDTRNLQGLDVEMVSGDLLDRESLRSGMNGCQTVYHLAAMVYFWVPPDQRARFSEVNVQGTKNVLSSALELDVEKVVYTSTVSTIGSYGREHPTTEEHEFNLWDMSMEYERSKYSAEFEAWRYAARGLPLVAVLPTAPVGARDTKPTPVGKLILDFLGRKLPGYIDGGGNFIDVDDIGYGHVLAAKRGRVGERYILGDANLTALDLFGALEEVSSVPAPRLKIPYGAALGLAHALELVANRVTRRHPLFTVPLVKFSGRYYFVDTTKAREELGFAPRSTVKHAARKAIQWFLENDYVRASDSVKGRIRSRLETAAA